MSIKKSPVYNVIAVPVEKVQANDYNPNVVAPPEMRLLELSIWEDGFTMPCVCYYDKEKDVYILVPPLFCAEDFETYLSERKRDVAYCGNRKGSFQSYEFHYPP